MGLQLNIIRSSHGLPPMSVLEKFYFVLNNVNSNLMIFHVNMILVSFKLVSAVVNVRTSHSNKIICVFIHTREPKRGRKFGP